MVMNPQHQKHSRAESKKIAAVDSAELELELARLTATSRQMMERLPSLLELVVVTDSSQRKALRDAIALCEKAVDAEDVALRSLRCIVPGKRSVAIKAHGDDLSERRSFVSALAHRADQLFLIGKQFPTEVKIVSKVQTGELLNALHAYRDEFWKALYAVPAVQRFALEELRQVASTELTPSFVIHYASAGKANESALKEAATKVVQTVDGLLARKASCKEGTREKIAAELLKTPLDPGVLSEQVTVLRSNAGKLADLEVGLKCTHCSIRSKAARNDLRFAEWRALADEFGGGALYARRIVSTIERVQEPYVRIIKYLTTANFPFIRNVVARKHHYRDLTEDMIQEGAMGFMRALDKFDPKSGFCLLTYAGYWVTQKVARGHERQATLIPVPKRLHSALSKLTQDPGQGRHSGDAGVAAELGVKPADVKALIPFTYGIASLDKNIRGSERRLGDVVPDREPQSGEFDIDILDRATFRDRIAQVLATLPERDQRILSKRFGLDGKGERTLKEIAQELRVTRERVRQIQEKALEKLREGPRGRELLRLADDLEL